jgi:hypothetical protein
LPLSAGLQPLLNLPVAQEPDNRFNQLSLTGTYDLAEKTRASFKLSYANTTQNQNFAASGLSGAPAGVTSLGGNVNTTLAWLGITSRPIPKLTLQADIRYADRDDKTPVAPYVMAGSSVYTNQQLPEQKVSGKLQAIYQFSREYRGTIGADYVGIDRGIYTPTSRGRWHQCIAPEHRRDRPVRRASQGDVGDLHRIDPPLRQPARWLQLAEAESRRGRDRGFRSVHRIQLFGDLLAHAGRPAAGKDQALWQLAA